MEDINKDRRGGSRRTFHTHGVEAPKKLKADYSLLDIWREKHSNVKQYTWNSRFENIASRIDRIYLDSAWLLNVKKCYIHPFVWSDHVYGRILFTTANKKREGDLETETGTEK